MRTLRIFGSLRGLSCGLPVPVRLLQAGGGGDILFFPFRQNLIRVFKAGLVDGGHSPAAGFQDQLQRKAPGLQPFIHEGSLHLYGIAAGDAEGLQDFIISPVVGGCLLARLGDGTDAVLAPATGSSFYVMNALMSAGYAVFDEILDELRAEAQRVMQIENLRYLPGA